MSDDLFKIRMAIPGDEQELTALSFASKRYWHYPDHYYRIWQPELTVSREYLQNNSVYCIENRLKIAAYYSLVFLAEDVSVMGTTLGRGHWLDHMFILPRYIGKGFGRKLFSHLLTTCKTKNIGSVSLLADPYARGFYEKMGCVYIRECPSTITGRTTPLLKIDIPA